MSGEGVRAGKLDAAEGEGWMDGSFQSMDIDGWMESGVRSKNGRIEEGEEGV